jgi:hypothetical protein
VREKVVIVGREGGLLLMYYNTRVVPESIVNIAAATISSGEK